MTDLELMQLLEDEGYEPSLENLLILKEGLETGEIEILNEARKTLGVGPNRDQESKDRSYAVAKGHEASYLKKIGDNKAAKAAIEAGKAYKAKASFPERKDSYTFKNEGIDTGNHNKEKSRNTVYKEVTSLQSKTKKKLKPHTYGMSKHIGSDFEFRDLTNNMSRDEVSTSHLKKALKKKI